MSKTLSHRRLGPLFFLLLLPPLLAIGSLRLNHMLVLISDGLRIRVHQPIQQGLHPLLRLEKKPLPLKWVVWPGAPDSKSSSDWSSALFSG